MHYSPKLRLNVVPAWLLAVLMPCLAASASDTSLLAWVPPMQDELDNGTRCYEARPYYLGADDAQVDAFDPMLDQIDPNWREHIENWRT
jgi:hypothetical protein